MPKAYFCNALGPGVRFSLNENGDPDAPPKNLRAIPPRTTSSDEQSNILPMIAIDITDSSEPVESEFSKTASNLLSVERPSVAGNIKHYDLAIDETQHGHDLFFYIFGHTLVGQNDEGVAQGISIEVHKLVKSLIQDGEQIGTIGPLVALTPASSSSEEGS